MEKDSSLPFLQAFLICRDVLVNSRAPSVISIIDVFNELRVNKFPAHLGTICLVALYGGAVGQFHHHFEVWERDEMVGKIDPMPFFLEDINSLFHGVSHIDGIYAEEPRHLIFKAFLEGKQTGQVSLGIFKPLGIPGPPEAGEYKN